MLLQATELLAEHLAQWAYSPAFPELLHVPAMQLKAFAKATPVERFRKQVKRPNPDPLSSPGKGSYHNTNFSYVTLLLSDARSPLETASLSASGYVSLSTRRTPASQ